MKNYKEEHIHYISESLYGETHNKIMKVNPIIMSKAEKRKLLREFFRISFLGDQGEYDY